MQFQEDVFGRVPRGLRGLGAVPVSPTPLGKKTSAADLQRMAANTAQQTARKKAKVLAREQAAKDRAQAIKLQKEAVVVAAKAQADAVKAVPEEKVDFRTVYEAAYAERLKLAAAVKANDCTAVKAHAEVFEALGIKSRHAYEALGKPTKFPDGKAVSWATFVQRGEAALAAAEKACAQATQVSNQVQGAADQQAEQARQAQALADQQAAAAAQAANEAKLAEERALAQQNELAAQQAAQALAEANAQAAAAAALQAQADAEAAAALQAQAQADQVAAAAPPASGGKTWMLLGAAAVAALLVFKR